MKRRKYIACFLMVVSMIMLTAAVLPHHHHREVLCLQHDVTECGCTCTDDLHTHKASDEAHSCQAGCVTEFRGVMPDEVSVNTSPNYAFCSLLYTAADVLILSLRLSGETTVPLSPYVERLHSTCLPHVAGLRAPPCVFA